VVPKQHWPAVFSAGLFKNGASSFMSPECWRKVNDIVRAARDQPAARVNEFVREACTGDPEIYSEVLRMLLAEEQTERLDRPVPFSPSQGSTFSSMQIVAGRYRVIRFLNRGGMGEVYEAEDLELKERVALKTLRPEIAADGRMISRFKQEIQLSRRVAHHNVCRVFDLDRHTAAESPGESVIFLSMEFLAGETLNARIQREGPFSSTAALPLLEQMADALHAAHSVGVIHRDFKPSNVMLVPSGGDVRAVVTDFGLARSVVASREDTVTVSGQLMGTLDYMSPELLTGSLPTVSSDVYALGMSAWKMITGDLPFRSQTPLAAAVLRSKMPAPSLRNQVPGIDPTWDRAVQRALDPNPDRRFANAKDFVGAIRGEPVSKPLSPARPTRGTMIAAAIFVVVLLAGVFVWSRWRDYTRRTSAEAASFYRLGTSDIHGGAYFAATKALEQAILAAPNFSLAHARLAEAWLELDSSEKAAREMLLARRQSNSELREIDRLQIQAIDLTVTREFDAAVLKYRRMLQLAPADTDIELDLARTYEKAGQMTKATESYLRVARSAVHNPAAWLHLAVLYSRASDSSKAAEAFRQAEQLYQASSNLEGLTETAQQRGIAANGRGQLEEARASLLKALETARLAGNIQQEISLKLRLSTNAYLAGDTQLAERYAGEALDAARANQMEALATRGIVNLGNASLRKGDFGNAEKYYGEALALAKRNNAQRLTALSLLSLAALHDQMKHSDQAAREAQEALVFYEPNGFARETLQATIIIGRSQANRANYDGALKSFEKALTIAEKSKDDFQTALAHESMGRIFHDRERYADALPHFQKYLALSTDAEHSGYAAIQTGDVLWRLGRYEEASALFAAADSKAEKFLPMRLAIALERAEMALSQGKYRESTALCRRIVAAAPDVVKLSEATIVLCMNETRSGSKRQALTDCESATTMAGKLEDNTLRLAAQLALAEARLNLGDRRGALDLLKQTEPSVADLPHTRLFLLALAARAGSDRMRESADGAKQQLADIETQLGPAAFHIFVRRHDVEDMLRPLSVALSAKK
jgi:eukaryotic-like serine/threonine-protein kinase